MPIPHPYLMFIGDAHDALAAKTARGVVHWRPEWCLGQLRLPGCNADLGLADMTVREAEIAGARTLVVGVANRGGVIADGWIPVIVEALERGMDVASGLHQRLTDRPAIAEAARRHGRRLYDVRHPDREFAVATGAPRSGRRLLAVGTDVSCGKMYTTLALERELRARGGKADFRATGQTGILIAGSGVSVDAVVSDFVSGAAEWLSPAADPDHWDLIEGQGSLFHTSYAGVSLGLLHGAQPQALVMCHDPARKTMRGLGDRPLPDLAECMDLNLLCARMVSPEARFVGLSFNTSGLPEADRRRALDAAAARFDLPCVDPVLTGVAAIADALA
ncbi:MAG: N-acetyltransferase DgcN [Alphaproteobacteria bacterium]